MMETNKYILCGGEDLCRTYEGLGISEKAKDLFNRWAIASLADPCLHERESFLDMPVSSETRLFIKAIRERNKGSRTLTWYLGVELSREEFGEASCYANLIRGMLAVSLESIKNLRSSETLSVNLQYPSGLPQIQTPFVELIGKNFYGEYPRILWEFCQKISLNDMADWFDRLFLAVNVEVEHAEYTNIICEDLPHKNFRNAPPRPQHPEPSPHIRHHKETPETKGGKWEMRKIFFFLWFVFTIAAVYWSIHQSIKLSDKAAILEEKDQIHQAKIAKLKSCHENDIAKKKKKIRELEDKITTLSAPKDIIKTLKDLEDQISEIEKRLDSINNIGPKLTELRQCLRELKKECGHPDTAKAGSK